jgi:hypothetical protein
MKKCTKCLVTKKNSEFYTSSSTKDGLQFWCRDCHIAYQKNKYVVKIETKKCTKCGEEKPLNDFYVIRKGKSEIRSICKKCEANKVREYESKLKNTYGATGLTCYGKNCNGKVIHPRFFRKISKSESIRRKQIPYALLCKDCERIEGKKNHKPKKIKKCRKGFWQRLLSLFKKGN